MQPLCRASRGFGFVMFDNEVSSSKALAQKDFLIDGRKVDIALAIPRRPAGEAPVVLPKLFVGGLPATFNSNQLTAYFSEYGPVRSAIVLMDPNTNRSRGFGFVTFEDEESVEAGMRAFYFSLGCPTCFLSSSFAYHAQSLW